MNLARKLLKWTFVTLMLLVGVALLVNRFEVPLDPGAQAALSSRPETIAPEQNLLFALIGFGYETEDYAGAGRKRAQDLLALAASGLSDDEFGERADVMPWPRIETANREQLRAGDDPLSLFQQTLSGATDPTRLIESNARLLLRYNELRHYPRFVDMPADWQASLAVRWVPVMDAGDLWSLSLARQIHAGHLDTALESLRQDADLWRRALRERNSALISEMVFTSNLARDLRIASLIAGTQALNDAQYAALEDLARPITEKERSLAGTFNHEYRYMTDGFNRMVVTGMLPEHAKSEFGSRLVDLILRSMFVPNAARNEVFAGVREAIALDAQGCVHYDGSAMAPDGTQPRYPWWSWLYNPVGKMLFSVAGQADYRRYIARRCDLVSVQRVLALQILLRRQRLTAAQVPQAIAKAGPDYTDPYTGAPLKWDAAQRTLSVSVRADNHSRLHLPWKL